MNNRRFFQMQWLNNSGKAATSKVVRSLKTIYKSLQDNEASKNHGNVNSTMITCTIIILSRHQTAIGAENQTHFIKSDTNWTNTVLHKAATSLFQNKFRDFSGNIFHTGDDELTDKIDSSKACNPCVRMKVIKVPEIFAEREKSDFSWSSVCKVSGK